MNRNKHIGIRNILEARINSSFYTEFMPPIRSLTKEFNVSLRTMNKSLKVLTAKGKIAPSPTGTRICLNKEDKKSNGMVGIVYISHVTNPLNDAMLSELNKSIINDGYKPFFLGMSDSDVVSNFDLWRGLKVDGYIFVYSSFYPLVTHHLHLGNIPFVVANWMPEGSLSHWVDFNNAQTLDDFCEQLTARGMRGIALSIGAKMIEGRTWLYEIWNKICDKHELVNYATGPESFYVDPLEEIERLAKLNSPPEVLICLHSKLKEAEDIFTRHNLKIHLVYQSDKPLMDITRHWNFPLPNYGELAVKVWHTFKRVLEGSVSFPCSHYVETHRKINFYGTSQINS